MITRKSTSLLQVFLFCFALQGFTAQAQTVIEPELGIGVFGDPPNVTFRGSPLILQLYFGLPAGEVAAAGSATVQPVQLSVPSGKWTRLVKLSVKNQQGVLQSWPFQVLTPVGASIQIAPDSPKELLVILPPEATSLLATGTYKLKLLLDSRTGSTPGSWKGWAIDDTTLEILDPPQAPVPAEQCSQALILAAYHEQKNNTAQAEAVLAQAPALVGCLAARAELATRTGNKKLAIDLYKQAITRQSQLRQPSDEPSTILERQCQLVMNSLPEAERDPLATCGYKECIAESEEEVCHRVSAQCGPLQATDICGNTSNIASCGTCTAPQTCGGSGVANQCGCAPETNAQFCSRQGKNCGSVTGQDNCGQSRTVTSCGTCSGTDSCGGAGTANVCGTCQPIPQATACANRQCGSASNGCGLMYSCGACQLGRQCSPMYGVCGLPCGQNGVLVCNDLYCVCDSSTDT
ncbi:tetratricopeptide repeat protein [Corallococcus exiguus]|uniref:tetratricopeptide repeat protein n=1 Tax=Corallococcus exiguus TaxID=83462 RepID=UPI00149416B6|nr:hypothetical protein [Corallococcus exiguus]NPD29864.1 hypothetical protein [Corallococcus exiguus]